MTAEELFGPETDEEKAEAEEHPVMGLFPSEDLDQQVLDIIMGIA